MRVAFVTNFCAHYRVKTFETLARRLDVEFLFFSEGGEWYWPRELGVSRGAFATTDLAGVGLAGTRITPALPVRLLGGGYDAVVKCINGRFALPAAYLSTRLARRPFVLWTGLWHRLATPAHRLVYPATRWIYRHADAIVVYGSHVERFLVGEGVDPERIFVAPHATDNVPYRREVPDKERDALRRELEIAPGAPVVLFVGRLERAKGVDLLLDAFLGLERPDAVLVVVGSGTLRDELAARTDAAGAAARVRLVPPMRPDAITSYYALADLLVLPSVTTASFKEPWGLVVNEAFNQAVPAVTSEAVGAAAGGLVEEGVTGLVVPEGDRRALTAALARLLEASPLRRALGEEARRRVATWDNERMVDGFVEAIEAACARKRG